MMHALVLLLVAVALFGVVGWFFFAHHRRATGRRVFCEPTLRGDDTLQRLRSRAGA